MNTLWTVLIKWFYGIDQLDEYRIQEINALGNKLFLAYLIFSQISLWGALILFLPNQQFEKIVWTILICQFLIFVICIVITAKFVNDKDLADIELDDMSMSDYRRNLQKRTFRSSLGMGIWFYIAPSLFDFFDKGSINLSQLVMINELGRVLITTGLFYVIIYYNQLREAKRLSKRG